MKRLFGGIALLILLVFAGYGYFKSSSPTAMLVVEEAGEVPVQQNTEIVVKEESVAPKKTVENVVVNNLALNSLWVYSTKEGSVVDMLQVGGSPTAVQVSPDGFWVYVLNSGSKSISVIDAGLMTIVKTVTIGEDPRTMRLNPAGDLLAVVTYSNKILFFETKEFKKVGVASTAKKPAGIVFAPEGKYLFSVAEKSGLLEKINPYIGSAISLAEVGKSPVALALTSKDRAFVVNSGSDSVSVIDVIDMSRAKKYDIPVGSKPVDIVLDGDEKLAFVANKDSNTVSVFDAENFKLVSEMRVGDAPSVLLYDKFASPAGLLYVANAGSNDIAVVDPLEGIELMRLKSGSRPSAMALSPDGKLLFVTMRGRN